MRAYGVIKPETTIERSVLLKEVLESVNTKNCEATLSQSSGPTKVKH